MRVTRVAVFAAAIAAIAAASALAASHTVAPTAAQRAAIINAFGDPQAASSCLTVRLAAANHSYATVRAHMTSACQKWQFNGTNVIKRTHDDHWKVAFEGSAYRCPVARIPHQVQRQLGVCPRRLIGTY